jgi:tripartite-type tricarboxylate transporter receptor subunit TctC
MHRMKTRAYQRIHRPSGFHIVLGPSSGADITARLMADQLTKRWNQPVVVENRPGSDGIVALTAFLANPDDHTLLFTPTGTFTTHPFFHDTLTYKQSDLVPIARVTNTIISIAVLPRRSSEPSPIWSCWHVHGPGS